MVEALQPLVHKASAGLQAVAEQRVSGDLLVALAVHLAAAPSVAATLIFIAALLDGHGALAVGGLAWRPVVSSQVYGIAQHEAYARHQLLVTGQLLHAREVLVHETAPFLRVQHAAAGLDELDQTLQVLLHLGRALAVPEQLGDALVNDAVGQYVQLAQLTDKLDVAQHLALGDVALLLILR